MQDRNLIDFEDFELVDGPFSSNSNSGTLTPSTESGDLAETTLRAEIEPPAAEQPAPAQPGADSLEQVLPDTPPSIPDLFYDPQTQTDLVVSVARILVALSLPFALTWAAFTAVIGALYERQSNDRLLQTVVEGVTDVSNSYGQRLLWVDRSLPEYLKRNTSNLTPFHQHLQSLKSTTKRILNSDRFFPFAILLIRGLWIFTIYFLLSLAFPKLRRKLRVLFLVPCLGWIPLWILLACLVRFVGGTCPRASFERNRGRRAERCRGRCGR